MKIWKLEPAEDLGVEVRADAFEFERHDDGFSVVCAHCDKVLLEGYKPSPSLTIDVLKCQHCGGFNRFDASPPQG